jgi:hypothetical protein
MFHFNLAICFAQRLKQIRFSEIFHSDEEIFAERLGSLKPKEEIPYNVVYLGHDQLLEICLLKKTGRHNFSTARHHSSK